MFKIVDKLNNLYGVLDTNDNSIEYYNRSQLSKILSSCRDKSTGRRIKISGVNTVGFYRGILIYYFDIDMIFKGKNYSVYYVDDCILISNNDNNIMLFSKDSKFYDFTRSKVLSYSISDNRSNIIYYLFCNDDFVKNASGINEDLKTIFNSIKAIKEVDDSLFIDSDNVLIEIHKSGRLLYCYNLVKRGDSSNV